MSDIIQLAIVVAAICAAVFVALRGLWRAIRHGNSCCSCPEANSCKLKQIKDNRNCDRTSGGRNSGCH